MASSAMGFSLHDVSRGLVAGYSVRGLRMTLVRGEALRVPGQARRLRVLSGRAWVSLDGEDRLLDCCGSIDLPRGTRGGAVVSPVGERELSFELA